MTKQRKNILWLSHLVPYPPTGGVLQRSHNLLKEVAKTHNIYLASFIQPALITPFFDSYEDGLEQCKDVLTKYCNDIALVDIPCEKPDGSKTKLVISSLASREPYTVRWLDSREMEDVLVRWKEKYNFDAIYTDTISLAPYRKIFSELPAIMNHHNIESHMMLRRSRKEPNPLKKAYFFLEGKKIALYEKRTLHEYDINITCSNTDSERLNKAIPGLTTDEIPNGVDLEYFSPDRTTVKKNSLIFAGGLNWYPNREAMLHFSQTIWPELKSKNEDVSMNLVGKYPPHELVTLSKLDQAFMVHGYVKDVRDYLNKAEIYICPIMDGGGTKLKILDALAMKIPVVAYEIACEGIDAIHGEHLLMGTTPEQLANLSKQLFESPELAEKISRNGRKLVEEKYSFTTIGKKLAQLLEQVSTK